MRFNMHINFASKEMNALSERDPTRMTLIFMRVLTHYYEEIPAEKYEAEGGSAKT